MRCIFTRFLLAGCLMFGFMASAAAADYIVTGFQCGNYKIFYLKSGKILYSSVADGTVTENEWDHLYAIGLELLATHRLAY